MAQPIALHITDNSHAACMKRAIALAVAKENAPLVVSVTAEHTRIGPDHCRGCFGFRGGRGGRGRGPWCGPGGDGRPSQSDALALNGTCGHGPDQVMLLLWDARRIGRYAGWFFKHRTVNVSLRNQPARRAVVLSTLQPRLVFAKTHRS